MSQRGVAFATAPRRLRGDIIYGGFTNPSFEAFVDPPDGFHDTPETPSNRDGTFSPPEARMAGEPRMQLFAPSAPAEKADFWFWATKYGGFSERLRPDLMQDRKRRSKTKNGVFRSGFFDQKKKLSYLKKIYIFFSDRKIQIEKRRFSFSICVFHLAQDRA